MLLEVEIFCPVCDRKLIKVANHEVSNAPIVRCLFCKREYEVREVYATIEQRNYKEIPPLFRDDGLLF